MADINIYINETEIFIELSYKMYGLNPIEEEL